MIVKTYCGHIEGIVENDLIVFKGVPYGEAPIGELRFKAPIAKRQWKGVLKCKGFSKKSMQYCGDDKKTLNNQSEDCLYLNIWTKNNNVKNKAVVVYIHGGGFIAGSGFDEILLGDTFGVDENIVYVSINYRLGALGFLNIRNILGEDYALSGNNGILDIILSLQWVNENIEFFGGDKNNITVMGESAGAKCIGGLLVTKKAKGLFKKAILQSGAIQALRSVETSVKITERLLEELKIKSDRSEDLLKISADEIIAAQQRICKYSSIHIFGPVIDGYLISDKYKVLGKKEGLEAVLMGVNKEEILIFLNGINNPLRDKNYEALQEIFGGNINEMWNVYDGYLQTMKPKKAYEEALTHCYYRIHSLKLGEELSNNEVDVWFYKFNWEGNFGACHAQDLSFVFNKSIPNDELHSIPREAQDLADTIHNTWKCFIKNSNPNNKKLPNWEKYFEKSRNFMNLGYECYMDNKWTIEELQYFPENVLVL